MSIMALTERQKRERDYYNKYATLHDPSKQEINLAPVLNVLNGIERRPWNSYWAIYEFAINEYTKDSSLLDFGTGPGENALKLAQIGYQISGFDISDKNIEIAQELFKSKDKQADFQVSFAEELPYADNSFDMIVGIDILHHVDIEKSINECYRVLKNGGKAFFREPIEVPLLDRIRETKLVQLFAPKKVSFEKHITEDERKLNQVDDRMIIQIFPKTKKHYYFLLARFDKFFREGSDPKPSILEKIDYFLIRTFPFLKKMCGTVIYELEK